MMCEHPSFHVFPSLGYNNARSAANGLKLQTRQNRSNTNGGRRYDRVIGNCKVAFLLWRIEKDQERYPDDIAYIEFTRDLPDEAGEAIKTIHRHFRAFSEQNNRAKLAESGSDQNKLVNHRAHSFASNTDPLRRVFFV